MPVPMPLELRRDSTVRAPERPAMSIEDEVAQAFEQLRDRVYRYVILLGVPAAEAQEITQEVFLKMYVARKNGEAIDSARAWSFRVAHNLGLNLRKRGGHSKPLPPGLEATLATQGATPEQGLLDQERRERMKRAVLGLSPQQRQCLELRTAGLRHHEIAGVLGIGTPTVGEFLRRAIARLKKVLHD